MEGDEVMPTLQYNDELHEYTVDGRRLPSVTEVLKGVGIIDTSQPWYTPYQRDRGKAIHLACEMLDTPGDGGLDWASMDARIIGYVRAWQTFLMESGAKVLNVERKLWSAEHGFAGTLDRVLWWNGLRTVVDIKTGQSEPWHALQTAAYQILDGAATERACVYLRPDGKFRVGVHPMREAANDRARFLAALATFNAKRGAA